MLCEKCNRPCKLPENDYGEFICQSCVDNKNEEAYERHIESFHDGGSTGWISLQELQRRAMKLK